MQYKNNLRARALWTLLFTYNIHITRRENKCEYFTVITMHYCYVWLFITVLLFSSSNNIRGAADSRGFWNAARRRRRQPAAATRTRDPQDVVERGRTTLAVMKSRRSSGGHALGRACTAFGTDGRTGERTDARWRPKRSGSACGIMAAWRAAINRQDDDRRTTL